MNIWGQFNLQEGVSIVMELMNYFHDYMVMILLMILTFVTYVFLFVISSSYIDKYTMDSHVIETIWTIVPMVILLFMAFPSLYLMYLVDDLLPNSLMVKVNNHHCFSLKFKSSDYPMDNLNFFGFCGEVIVDEGGFSGLDSIFYSLGSDLSNTSSGFYSNSSLPGGESPCFTIDSAVVNKINKILRLNDCVESTKDYSMEYTQYVLSESCPSPGKGQFSSFMNTSKVKSYFNLSYFDAMNKGADVYREYLKFSTDLSSPLFWPTPESSPILAGEAMLKIHNFLCSVSDSNTDVDAATQAVVKFIKLKLNKGTFIVFDKKVYPALTCLDMYELYNCILLKGFNSANPKHFGLWNKPHLSAVVDFIKGKSFDLSHKDESYVSRLMSSLSCFWGSIWGSKSCK